MSNLIPEKFQSIAEVLLDHASDPQHPSVISARDFVMEAAESGDTYANYIVANWQVHELYGAAYDEDAIRSRLQCAIKGLHPEALYDYATFCMKMPRVGKKLALGYFLAAALLGDEDALYNVIVCFEQGLGVYKNEEISKLLEAVSEKIANRTPA